MGEYVAGNVLSEHEVNSLKDSSIVRDLVGSGPASAFVSRLGEHSLHLNGKSDLAVRLGGGSGTWQGTFNLENPEGDYLSIETMTVDLGPQGHLKIDSPAELARFEGMLRGTSYYSTTELDQAKMTGNLVGPGPGHDRPVTGAIGSGRLKTYDERTIDILHSANLNDRPVAAQ